MKSEIVCDKCGENMRMIHPYWVDPQLQCRNSKCENHEFKRRVSEMAKPDGLEFRELSH